MKFGKLFVSANQGEADRYRLAFENAFGHLFVPKPPLPADLDSGSADAYIAALRRQGLIDATTCVVVLVSRLAHASRRVDWEIAAALEQEAAAALLGVMLPDMPRRMPAQGAAPGVPFFDYKDMPPRLADNVKSGYVRIYDWTWLCSDERRVVDALSAGAATRRERSQLIDNSRPRLTNDLPLPAVMYPAQRERRRGT